MGLTGAIRRLLCVGAPQAEGAVAASCSIGERQKARDGKALSGSQAGIKATRALPEKKAASHEAIKPEIQRARKTTKPANQQLFDSVAGHAGLLNCCISILWVSANWLQELNTNESTCEAKCGCPMSLATSLTSSASKPHISLKPSPRINPSPAP